MTSEDSGSKGFASDPAAVLEGVFSEILRTRMEGVPILNPALKVEAVGFGRTSAGWMGVLVTPWFMNLMLLPSTGIPWQGLPMGAKRLVGLPAGTFEFFGGAEDGLGEYLYCSLFSPMSQFADHAGAQATASEICRMIFDEQVGRQVRELNPTGLKWFEVKAEKADSAEPAPEIRVSASRRNFLAGRSRARNA